MTAETFDCLLLSRQWRDGPKSVEITLWGLSKDGPVKAVLDAEAVMFVPRTTPEALTAAGRRAPVELKTLQGDPVDAVYFRQQRSLLDARDRVRTQLHAALESDVKPSDRFVMERFVTGAFEVSGKVVQRRAAKGGVTVIRGGRVRGIERPEGVGLSVCSFDIETDGPDGALLSYAVVAQDREPSSPRIERVVVVGPPVQASADLPLSFVPTERALLESFVATMTELDPDILIGWNVVEFDLATLESRCNGLRIPFAIGRNGETGRVLRGDRGQASIARIPGRVVLDGIATLKNATWSFERYTLEHVGRELLGRGKLVEAKATKLERIEEIRRMAREDIGALAAYNLEDARLVADIFDKANLLGFACARADLVGLPLDRQGGSVAAFDHLYLPRLHREGFVAPDVGSDVDFEPSPGGEVLASVPGLHKDVLAFDFRSLYPSIIRTFRIDPLGLHLATLEGEEGAANHVDGFDGGRFVRSPSILPPLIEKLASARKEAQQRGDEALSRAIKIQMNSFYGVLGAPGCRFFDSRLASSITRRGHQIIRRAKSFFEERGYTVLYGDTDSLFVHAEGRTSGEGFRALGADLARALNETLRGEIREQYDLESALDLRFDTYFTSYLMPTVRSGDVGSKKRYAGAASKIRPDGSTEMEIVVKGLEAVRTDWTPFARRVQRELLRRVFSAEPWESWLRETRAALFRGAFDAELVYRKRLRRDIDEYGAAPPHVKAARLANERQAASGVAVDKSLGRDDIEYLMTSRGPVPLDAAAGAVIDYAHYVDKQLAPACDVVLSVLGTSFERVAGTQLGLFDS
ncbi:MAG: DNA polymerase II [Polyangiaceae bacterium]|nr:DNA polymerase II [Polyangiaceae bacterium]